MQTIELSRDRVRALLDSMKGIRAMVAGDLCLDTYWMADMRLSSLSRETPHYNMPVVEERYSMGGSGNVIANMRSLGALVTPVTVLGADWRARQVMELAREMELPEAGLISAPGRVTPTYVKPLRRGYGEAHYEDPRLDFENHTQLSKSDEDRVIEAIREGAGRADVIVATDQMAAGVVTGRVRDELIRLARSGKLVLADSRDRIAEFKSCVVKPNELESARAAGLVPESVTAMAYMPVARRLSELTGGSVVITLGGAGAICLIGEEYFFAPARRVPPPIDIVGAGDAFMAAFALALGAGAPLYEAMALGNLASAVTIRKLGQTGTASAEEIMEIV